MTTPSARSPHASWTTPARVTVMDERFREGPWAERPIFCAPVLQESVDALWEAGTHHIISKEQHPLVV
jgi:hypothetical protein